MSSSLSFLFFIIYEHASLGYLCCYTHNISVVSPSGLLRVFVFLLDNVLRISIWTLYSIYEGRSFSCRLSMSKGYLITFNIHLSYSLSVVCSFLPLKQNTWPFSTFRYRDRTCNCQGTKYFYQRFKQLEQSGFGILNPWVYCPNAGGGTVWVPWLNWWYFFLNKMLPDGIHLYDISTKEVVST